jgi:hypothetical protein
MTPHTSRVGSRGSQSLPGVYQCAAVALSRRYRGECGRQLLVSGRPLYLTAGRAETGGGEVVGSSVRSPESFASNAAIFPRSVPIVAAAWRNPTAYRSTKSMVFVGSEFPYMHQHRADALLHRDELEMCRFRFQVRVAGNPPPEMKRALREDGAEADTIVKLKGPLFGTKQSASCYCRNKFFDSAQTSALVAPSQTSRTTRSGSPPPWPECLAAQGHSGERRRDRHSSCYGGGTASAWMGTSTRTGSRAVVRERACRAHCAQHATTLRLRFQSRLSL